jgi:predicted ArsR family transcriptional regulator
VTGTAEASSPVARDKVAEAARRGDMMRRIMAEEDSALGREATNQLDALIEHLEESGFEPVVDEGELTVDLSPCPHVVSRPEHRPMLCQVHLGLMQGILAQAGGPLATSCVQEAARPEECTVQLRRTAA